MEQGLARSFDNTDPSFGPPPHATFRALQERCPVGWSEERGGFWVVSRYADVRDIAMDPATFSSAGSMSWTAFDPETALRPIELDPPEHLTFRSLVLAPFTQPRVAELEPLARELANDLIDRFVAHGECDLAQDYALPLPSHVIAHMLGAPRAEWDDFLGIATDVVRAVVEGREIDGAAGPWAYGSELFHAPERARPGSLVEALFQARVDGRPLTEAEFVGMFTVLMTGGQDTTQALIAQSLLHLARHPEDRDRLVADPSLVPTAVEEFLRWESPVHAGQRRATVDTEVGGCPVRAGDRLVVLWGAANCDEAVFADPEAVVLDRTPNRHVAFGVGIHRCLGLHLARLEAKVCLEELLRRVPDYVVAPEEEITRYVIGGMVRGIWSLPATFTPAPRAASTV